MPDTCRALGDDLNRLISAYWESEPTTDVHFLIEAERFCSFLRAQPDVPAAALPHLNREHRLIAAKLAASHGVTGSPWDPDHP